MHLRRLWLLPVFLGFGLILGLFGGMELKVQARAAEAVAQAGAVAPFLYPPYPGRAVQSSIFDHSNPNYTQTDRRIVLYSGDVAYKDCPNPPPPGPPPPRGVCDNGYGGYWSYSLGDWIYYNGHDGVDYAIAYRPLYAAAEADKVSYAGWWDPQDHRTALGLYVKLQHPNGYSTVYGHMSALAVQTCSSTPCPTVARGQVIGYSGNTGNSTGPHLHFSVFNAANKPVDPYGWGGEEGSDPWVYNPSNPLWVAYPALEYYGARILPSGDPLPFPAAPSGGRIVDDGSVNFDETPANCWQRAFTQPAEAQGGAMRYAPASATVTCTATWQLPPNSPPAFMRSTSAFLPSMLVPRAPSISFAIRDATIG